MQEQTWLWRKWRIYCMTDKDLDRRLRLLAILWRCSGQIALTLVHGLHGWNILWQEKKILFGRKVVRSKPDQPDRRLRPWFHNTWVLWQTIYMDHSGQSNKIKMRWDDEMLKCLFELKCICCVSVTVHFMFCVKLCTKVFCWHYIIESILMEWKPNTVRHRGRPWKRWMDIAQCQGVCQSQRIYTEGDRTISTVPVNGRTSSLTDRP